jgi:class 3 adenylate cyclase
MADTSKINRTWLCSVVFLDIVNYSSQSVELQIKWKDRFNRYLAEAIKDVPEDERVILDTGDGAATCFLGSPEVAMFSALDLWHSMLLDERDQQPPFKVRIGINLGPVKLVRDINGAPNAIGDGMNAGQRIMSFAGENQILVSQSYFEVVSRLSDDYKNLFTLKGVETDKHIREHTVYNLSPPGAQHTPAPVRLAQEPVPLPAEAPEAVAQAAPKIPQPAKPRGSRTIPVLIGGIAVLVVAAAAAWHFTGSAPATQSPAVAVTPAAAVPSAPAPPPPVSAPVAVSQAPAVTPPSTPSPKPAVASTPVAHPVEEAPAPPPPQPAAVSAADQATARDLRERYASDASRAATARRNAEDIRRNLAAKGMSLNAQTDASLDRLQLFLDEASESIRDHKWDDALSSLQAAEAITDKINKTVGN